VRGKTESSRRSRDVRSVYAVTEKETPETLRIDKMLILYKDGTNATFLGGTPLRWKVTPGDEKFVKSALVMFACQGEEAVMTKVSPDHVYQVTKEEFDEVLRKLGRDAAAE